jgi:N-acyl-D-amino-acid deacylase
MFPYTAAATTMAAIFPPWSLEGGIEALVRRLKEPRERERIRRDIGEVAPMWPPWGGNGWAHNLVRAVGWERIHVGTVATASGRRAEGLSLAALGEREGRTPFEAIADLMIDQDGRVSQIIHGISGEEGREEGIEEILSHPAGAICTDANDTGRGLPHPAAYGAFPRVLGRYVRERGLLTLEEAIRKMTSYPASILGLDDRGVLREGAAADLVVFDAENIGSEATFSNPRTLASGIASVWVNGARVFENGRLTSEFPGRVLRSGAAR